MEILNIENLSFTYPGMKNTALTDINISVDEGDFIVICGQSGCGKTTLLKLIKRELAPFGEISGNIRYNISPNEVGYVFQKPAQQIVTDKVWHELAFGLENLGVPTQVIRRRIGEMASYFGIENLFDRKTDTLSGGQTQLVNLASVMVMQPKILLLDEPTSQLDPIAAAEFIGTLQKLNKELGLTIILAEHRLEEVFPVADKVMIMDSGKVIFYNDPRLAGSADLGLPGEHPMSAALPSAVRIFRKLSADLKNISEDFEECPVTVKEGRKFITKYFSNRKKEILEIEPYSYEEEEAVKLSDVCFRYERDLPDVLHGLNLSVYSREIYCILGGNGTGKTTALNVIAGISKPYRGKFIFPKGRKIVMLPQNPEEVFVKDTVLEDLQEVIKASGGCESERFKNAHGKCEEIEYICRKLGLEELLDRHPYDLSGGEQQKCAIAKLLLLKPDILLLDEPTKGIDAGNKKILSEILANLKKEGMTIIMVTHDVEFTAYNADRCALFFNGEIISEDIPTEFFGGNNFYTTAANRIARHMYKNVATCEDVVCMCKANKANISTKKAWIERKNEEL